ncbi:hypothetical protein HMPREF1633_03115 [Tissierellia bacterium S5-A11]|nr:hypothetical protein HMPREF1633_03115 [Tissierellia bacterium S5-A11]
MRSFFIAQNTVGKFFCFYFRSAIFLTWCRRNFYFENFILQGNELKSFYDARQTADEKFS